MDARDEGIMQRSFSRDSLEGDWGKTDFDGHTAFQSMTFTQKLTWVSEAVVSIYMLAKDNPGAECNLFFERCLDR